MKQEYRIQEPEFRRNDKTTQRNISEMRPYSVSWLNEKRTTVVYKCIIHKITTKEVVQ